MTFHVPVWAHVRNDQIAVERLASLVGPADREAAVDAVHAVAGRELADGVGLIQWVSVCRNGGGLGCTCYLAAEAYSTWPPRVTAGAIDRVTARAPAPAKVTASRKDEHLDLCAAEAVEPPGSSSMLDCVSLVHCAMPELRFADVNTSTQWLGKRLELPFLITGMTGGTERASEVNHNLAALAEKLGVAFGVGSQRAMSQDPALARTYAVRDVAPRTVLLGNIGAQQARELGVGGVRALMEAIGADAMAIHLNTAQELTQPEGDRDFTGFSRTIAELVDGLDGRVVLKETGCGISPAVAEKLVALGVRNIDVSGAGGTSWVRVEQLRAGASAGIGPTFAPWGIPTAAATATVRAAVGEAPTIIASGGIRSGLDIAKVLALGASLAGAALPIFRALEAGGPDAAEAALRQLGTELRTAMLLTGSTTTADLRTRPRILLSPLSDWCAAIAGAPSEASTVVQV